MMDDENKKTMLYFLAKVMMLDGNISYKEEELLKQLCSEISDNYYGQLLAWIHDPSQEEPTLNIRDRDEVSELLANTILMIVADGDVTEREMSTCYRLAKQYGVDVSLVDQWIATTLDQLAS
jgi:uncharacterized tellurite resistance protein B-like protein